MEGEGIRAVMYLVLVLGGGVLVGILAVLLIIASATFVAWLAIAISSFKSRRAQAAVTCL